MCTVSFIPLKDRVFITTNRDERISRKKALPPSLIKHKEQLFIFPKDADAGGTWIVTKENGDSAVLLNGAFVNHIHQPPYLQSRGIILLDILAEDHPSGSFTKIDLSNIEPFTIVLMEEQLLYEFRWDGAKRSLKQLPNELPQLWSSVTLYDDGAIKKREEWFKDFIEKNLTPTREDIFNFHQFTGDGNLKNDLLMHREGAHSTVSVTCIEAKKEITEMVYLDLIDGKEYISSMETKTVFVK